MSQTVITEAFEQWKAQQAVNGQSVILDEFVFANVPGLDPSKEIDRKEGLPSDAYIVYRQSVSKTGLVNDNAVVYSVTIGADVGDFAFNWIGLSNKATGTLAMIVHAPMQNKVKNANGQQGNVLTRSFLMEYAGAVNQTLISTPAETWQIDFTARLAGMDESLRLANFDTYGPGAFFDNGFLVEKTGSQYFINAGVGYVGGLRASLQEITRVDTSATPTKIWVDASYVGTLTSAYKVVVKFHSAPALSNYITNGVAHYVFALASIDGNGIITDLRPRGSSLYLRKDKNLAEIADPVAGLKNLNGVPQTRRINNKALSNDVVLTPRDVGALSAEGGDAAYINNSAHYAIRPGAWEGLGSFANQFADPSAPFVVPRGFAAGRGFSQYHPLVKGILETKSLGYAGAVSFGALTTGNANYPLAAINVTGDNGTTRAWTFDPADGSFVSEGDIGSRKNIVAAGGVYESGGDVRVYSPSYRPSPEAIGALSSGGTAVAAQKLASVRYISGVPFDGTRDISITASNVGALPAAGGDTAYINNSAHYAIKPGVWEGAGAFADQLYLAAPFVVPSGFHAINGVSQYNPIVKAIIGTRVHDYTAAVSFGALTTGNANFPIATIHVVGDGGLSQAWLFNPSDGSFTSPGDVGSNKNIVASGAVYESGGNVRVYSPNYRPAPADIGAYSQRGGQLDGDMNATGAVTSGQGRDIASGRNIVANGGVFDSGVRVYSRNNKPTPAEIGAIQTDTCSAAGFVAGNAQVPYLRNSANNEVVTLARWDWVSNTFAPKDWVSNTFAARDWVSNTFIGRDSCSYAGFASGNTQAPYMQHLATNEVVTLARQDWVYGNFITRITRGAQASMIMDGDLVEAPAGCVLTGGNGNEGNQVGYALYRPLMIMRAGTWLTIEG